MRVVEAAERLDVSPSLVYVLIKSGKLRCTRHGVKRGCIRISEDQLTEYLARAEAEPPPPPPAVPAKKAGWIQL